MTQRGVPTQFIEEKQKAYELDKRRISALAEKKLDAAAPARAERDAAPKRVDSYSRDRDGGRESSRVHERDEVKRHYDRDSRGDSGRATGPRGVSNTPAWMVAEMEAAKSKPGDGHVSRSLVDKDDRRDSRKDDDSDRQRRPDSSGGGRISNSEGEGKDRRTRDSHRRDDDRDRSRERYSRRDSDRRDRSRDRDRDRRRSRSRSRDRGRKDRGDDERSSRRDDGRVRRSRRSRSPVVSSSSSGGSLSPASK